MIVIRIDLHHAVKGGVTRLLTMTISNRGDHPKRPHRGNYTVRMGRKGQTDVKDIHRKPQRVATVEDYPRNTYHVRELIRRALEALK